MRIAFTVPLIITEAICPPTSGLLNDDTLAVMRGAADELCVSGFEVQDALVDAEVLIDAKVLDVSGSLLLSTLALIAASEKAVEMSFSLLCEVLAVVMLLFIHFQ